MQRHINFEATHAAMFAGKRRTRQPSVVDAASQGRDELSRADAAAALDAALDSANLMLQTALALMAEVQQARAALAPNTD